MPGFVPRRWRAWAGARTPSWPTLSSPCWTIPTSLWVARPRSPSGSLGHPTGITHIQRFHAGVSDPISQAAAAIGLALLGDQTGLETILAGMQDSRLAPPLRDLIRACTKETQEKFFAALTLDSSLFWLEDPQKFRSKVVEHYVGVLQSDRQPSARIRAMQALALFGERRCAPILETSLKKDPNATVRAQALASLGQFLEVPELLKRLVLAIRDPADEVRLQAAHTLDGLAPADVKPHREQLIELLETENDELQGGRLQTALRLLQTRLESARRSPYGGREDR